MIYNDLVSFSSPTPPGKPSIDQAFLNFVHFEQIIPSWTSFTRIWGVFQAQLRQGSLQFTRISENFVHFEQTSPSWTSFTTIWGVFQVQLRQGSLQLTRITNVVEFPIFGEIAGVNHYQVQRSSLALEDAPSWSWKWHFRQHFHEFQQKLTLFVTSLVFFRRNGDVGTCQDHFFPMLRWLAVREEEEKINDLNGLMSKTKVLLMKNLTKIQSAKENWTTQTDICFDWNNNKQLMRGFVRFKVEIFWEVHIDWKKKNPGQEFAEFAQECAI